MKIIRLKHYRCGEWDKNSYVVASDEITEDELAVDIDAAQEEYVKSLLEGKRERPVLKYSPFSLTGFPDTLTIAEAKELLKKQQEELDVWEEKQRKANAGFLAYLTKHGYKLLSDLDEEDGILEGNVDWGHGHNHSLSIKYE